jgi:hypothetical protein
MDRRVASEGFLQCRLGLLHNGGFRHRCRKRNIAAGRDGLHVLEAAGLERFLQIGHRYGAVTTNVDAAKECYVLGHFEVGLAIRLPTPC